MEVIMNFLFYQCVGSPNNFHTLLIHLSKKA